MVLVESSCKTLKAIHQKAEKWALQHGSQFAPAKYELVHFTRDPKANTTHSLRLPHSTIKASPSCRYLGVQMDSRLRWDHHREKVEAKATKRLLALSALASSTWGTGMIIPQMLYGCSAWHIPGSSRAGRSQPHLAHGISRTISKTVELHSSAKMTPIEKALADLESQKCPNYSKTALLFGVDRSTLSRRHRGVTGSRAEKISNGKLLSS